MSIIITSLIATGFVAVAYGFYCAGAIATGTMCAIAMVAICLLPMRAATSKFVPWAIEYYCSRDSDVRAKVRERWVTEPLDPEKKKFLNNGITLMGNAVIWVGWFSVALLFWAFKPLSVHSISMMLYTVRSLKHLLGAPTEIFAFVVWFVFTIALVSGIFLLYVAFRRNYTARKTGQDEPYNISFCIKIFLALFVVRKLYTYFYYGLTFQEALVDILLWWSIPTMYVLLEYIIRGINTNL